MGTSKEERNIQVTKCILIVMALLQGTPGGVSLFALVW